MKADREKGYEELEPVHVLLFVFFKREIRWKLGHTLLPETFTTRHEQVPKKWNRKKENEAC